MEDLVNLFQILEQVLRMTFEMSLLAENSNCNPNALIYSSLTESSWSTSVPSYHIRGATTTFQREKLRKEKNK